jgi:hypothetical protein
MEGRDRLEFIMGNACILLVEKGARKGKLQVNRMGMGPPSFAYHDNVSLSKVAKVESYMIIEGQRPHTPFYLIPKV